MITRKTKKEENQNKEKDKKRQKVNKRRKYMMDWKKRDDE
jgi:hypothetical protein